ncbi:protein arginine N-methyltransferase 3-like isoform X2 [Dysidea avara]
MINFIRGKEIDAAELLKMAVPPFPWEDDSNLKPVVEDDPLLFFDFESLSLDASTAPPSSEPTIDQYKTALSHALEELQIMKAKVHELLVVDSSTASQLPSTDYQEEEDGYYSSYTHFGIHEEMLKDRVRTETYREFILHNSEIFKDKIVLDLGCGTGILSMFAVQAGAAKVYAVDNSEVIYKAIDIIRENKLQDKIILIKEEIEQLQLPVEKVDVIISEWMGYFLLFESMLDTVIFARDKWLKDHSYIYPNKCSVSVAAVSCEEYWSDRVDYWNDVYGFKMTCMRSELLKEATVMFIDPDWIISSHDVLKKFNVTSVQVADLNFKSSFTLVITRNGICHAIVGYFDVSFMSHCSEPFHFSSSPADDPTHWKQTMFHLHEPITVKTGDMLIGTLSCRKLQGDKRSLDVTMELKHFTDTSTPTSSVKYHYVLQ